MTGQKYVPSRMNEAHWYREGAKQVLDNSLNSLMQMDHVIRVDSGGLVWEDVTGVWAPEFYVDVDDDGQVMSDGIEDMHAQIERQGWEAVRGWSVGAGAIMHESQFVGAGLAEHIIETPGLWVACVVHTIEDRDDNTAGWIVLHQEVEGMNK